ncbi:hypothetical protein GA0070610_1216 [Micromonospora echinofusca]|uniref:Uncharacterized protein n=1 Tax=Micromonospora echinofusca TaxID=47858 RepID=A0A1C5G5H1_MICEH|nr:hypothetical protein [Micromonospora echinofusca]SCG14991.1 hypothetical protein GA0070610_1216 [Micromonospora echinofusca]
MKAGDVLHLTRAASPQFVRPIFFRLIKIRTELYTYDGWIWMDGYQLDEKGDAIARRELFVLKAGVRTQLPPSKAWPKAQARQALR